MNKKILVKINNSKLPIFLQNIISEVEKYYDEESIETLEELVRLSYLLHYFKLDEEAQILSKGISSIPFTNNRDLWCWVEAGIILNMKYQRHLNNNNEITTLKYKILQKFEVGTELARKTNRKVFERTLQGAHLSTSKIDKAASQRDYNTEFSRRLMYLVKLYFIQEMRESENMSMKEIKKKINSNLDKMKLIEDRITFSNVIFNL
ncbi:hypothetical protein HCB47_03245 [Listeria sp. FSL L7-0072]|uniref:Uncharacterized protein n=3 Tax=Listeria farberi TaxID=2713500 RepID=A0A7X1DDH3_9LIST|nr:DUF6707 family protein [Listeria farberi]MBC1374391.1 hypothetical protein [Listeria farberi]MBC1380957.1 hypothetical protein [Listeria farberi]MBC2286653.1 hypothetical protein [Listeria farberi]